VEPSRGCPYRDVLLITLVSIWNHAACERAEGRASGSEIGFGSIEDAVSTASVRDSFPRSEITEIEEKATKMGSRKRKTAEYIPSSIFENTAMPTPQTAVRKRKDPDLIVIVGLLRLSFRLAESRVAIIRPNRIGSK
jgi:hypothetical protein